MFIDDNIEECYSSKSNRLIDLARRAFNDDSIDNDRRDEIFRIIALAYGQLDDE